MRYFLPAVYAYVSIRKYVRLQGSYCADLCFVAPDSGKMQGKLVRLFLEIILLIAGTRASEHCVVYYVKIYVARDPGRTVISR